MKPGGPLKKYNFKVQSFLLSPFFIALVISGVVFLFMPGFDKYQLELIEKFDVDKKGGIAFYDDLDNDGFSEYIISFENRAKEHAVKVLTHDSRIVNQWNFERKIPPHKENCPVFTGDFNNDGYKELFALNWINDSVYLDIICPMDPSGFERRNIFIDVIAGYSEVADFQAGFIRLFDLNGDGSKELLFLINAGFSIQPRKLYAYDIIGNTLKKTPKAGVTLVNFKILDIDHDNRVEISGHISGPGNIMPSMNIPYRDSSSWLMVFNDELEFEFEPVEFPAYKSALQVIPLKIKDGIYLLGLFKNQGVQELENSIYLFNHRGEVLHQRKIPAHADKHPVLVEFEGKDLYETAYLKNDKHEVYKINKDLSLQKIAEDINTGRILAHDLDNDGKDEYISIASTSDELLVIENNFKSSTGLKYIENPVSYFKLSIRQKGNQVKNVCVQQGGFCYIIDYSKNPVYRFGFLIYLGIFLIIWLFIFGIRRIYRNQLLRQQAISREISELQFKSINNQINPHFIFNAMNSITSAIYKENKEEAYTFGTKFSNLMREALMSSESISRSLGKEIEFVRNYLDLEKFRFKDVFDYSISIDPAVNMQTEVPKTIIQTFAENSVKHAMRGREEGGKIKIEVKIQNDLLVISIEDNGIGRSRAKETATGTTGKGLAIIRQIFDLYSQLKGVRINYSIEDLKEVSGNSKGTCVTIELPYKEIRAESGSKK